MLDPNFLLSFDDSIFVVTIAQPEGGGLVGIVCERLEDLWLASLLCEVDSIDVIEDAKLEIKREGLLDISHKGIKVYSNGLTVAGSS